MARSLEDASDQQYDVCLSFAGEQRGYVEEVALSLRGRGIRIFYDDFEQVALWGKDLYEHLDWVYRKAARYCVLFASSDYARKVWTSHERRSAQARALEENQEYVLPARFDSTEIPGLRPTVGYLDLRGMTPVELAELIQAKLGPRTHHNFFPPVPDLLFEALHAETEEDRDAVMTVGMSFMESLRRMTVQERRLLAEVFREGCTAELPDNVHIDLDLIRRDIRVSPTEALALLRGMRSVGITAEVRQREEGDHDGDMVVVEWGDYYDHSDDAVTEEWSFERSTEVAYMMLHMAGKYCRDCGRAAVEILDFSPLSSSTS